MYGRRVSHCVAKFFSVTRKSPTSACRPSMSSTRRVRSMRLANRSLGGAVAVAAAVESGAAAAGEAAAAAVVAGAAGAGDVAPSAKRHTSSKHNTKPQPVHYELAGAQLWLCPPNGAPVTIRLQCLARVNSRGVHRFAQRRHPACLERLRRRKPPIGLSAWRTTDGTPSSRMIRSSDAQAPAQPAQPNEARR
jgi:hypothetical protein